MPDTNGIVFKTKNFSDSFVQYLEDTSNFKYLEKKDDSHNYFVPEITDNEGLGYTTL